MRGRAGGCIGGDKEGEGKWGRWEETAEASIGMTSPSSESSSLSSSIEAEGSAITWAPGMRRPAGATSAARG